MKLIVNELKENLTTVDNSIKYHQQLKPAVIEFISKNKGEDFDKPFLRDSMDLRKMISGWKGIGFPKFKTTVFESVMSTGKLDNIPIENLSEITKIYNYIELYKNVNDVFMEKFMSMDSNTKLKDFAFNLRLLVEDDILGNELQLKAALEKAIKALEASQL